MYASEKKKRSIETLTEPCKKDVSTSFNKVQKIISLTSSGVPRGETRWW
jgi:hypothetical protein